MRLCAMAVCGMESGSFFPQWMLSRALPDQRFAEDYEAMAPGGRAWLKKNIAVAHARHGGVRFGPRYEAVEYDLGFSAMEQTERRIWAAVFIGPAVLSPARVLAAVLAALLSGMEQVIVARISPGVDDCPAWPLGVLAGLELCGQELAVDAAPDQATRLIQAMAEAGGPGAVLDLGAEVAMPDTENAWAPGHVVRWTVRPAPPRLAVWADKDTEWDFETLARTHPEARFTVSGPGAFGAPLGSVESGEDIESLIAKGYDAVFAPRALVKQALGAAPLVLGPGFEGCWFWPGLDSGFFRRGNVAFHEQQGPSRLMGDIS